VKGVGDEEELLAAIQANDATKVRTVLGRNPFVARMKTPNGTAVLTAKYHGADAALGALLERVEEDRLNVYEASALGRAGRLKTILGQSRTRVNQPNPEGFTPLGLAAFFGHADAVRVLLDHGATVDQVDRSRFANTALDAAVAANHADVARILLAAGASANVRDAVRATPLHKAAQNGNPEVVRMLLERGADVTAVRDGGHTPLADARDKGHGEVVELLRAHGAH
jgi:ankyrin repeat protein